jgi:glycosyltransferase involved in cell wall biosynthesis
MKLITTLETRFDRTPDGAVWTQSSSNYAQARYYLEVFDKVRIIARIRDVPEPTLGWTQVDDPKVFFIPLPHYIGPWQYLQKAREIERILHRAIGTEDAAIVNVPSQITTVVSSALRWSGHPYGVRVVGDPYDVFAPGIVEHPLRPLLRWWFVRNQKRQCSKANAVAYVNASRLPHRYPAGAESYVTHYADGSLSDETYVNVSRSLTDNFKTFTLITVGSLEQLYKGTDILINAVSKCVNDELPLRLVILGDGRFRPQLEAQARSLGLTEIVRFVGQVAAGRAVRDYLDQADVFILPSRTEGLPRALMEAMARALPCIGSTAGGIPELLPVDDLVPPGNVNALANKIYEVLTDPERMSKMSARNLAEARKYHENELRQRRKAFFQHIKDITLAWQQNRKA